ncbi:MAG TPA: hypothetical protein VNZ52_00295 [Candidatus Thermoplasmatota archaeon]|nr:hypothetical protein [Candidatus Thermoplasmatota archaeon]
MPSIELEGHSDAEFQLIDGKIVRVEKGATGHKHPDALHQRPELGRPGRE